ncbi:hypothetical protein HHI36_006884 [Cryptolaemus montrouzieri]|uniref:Uncharacterized protein n=1 Tax=Cryptolaemus montrouzieri TaxID=559131 RepID=A0ABD2MN07_9CUCU
MSYEQYIHNSNNKIRYTWNVINHEIGQQSEDTDHRKTSDFMDQGMSPEEVLNNFNDYFASMCPDVNSKSQVDLSLVERNDKTLVLFPTDLLEIHSCIKTLKNVESVGDD